jgi:hypothetical protein
MGIQKYPVTMEQGMEGLPVECWISRRAWKNMLQKELTHRVV